MSKPGVIRQFVQRIIAVFLFTLLAACGGGTTEALNNLNQLLDNSNNTDSNNDTQFMISGSVGDGPITGAIVTVTAADSTVLTTTTSDINANYTIMVPQEAAYPYILTTTSGIDLVTGTAPTFDMVSVVTGPDDTFVNINPFTTLIVKTAQAMPGGLTATNLDMANQIIVEELNFGLDTLLVPNPVTTQITDQNVATIVKASEVLAEMIRRTQAALQVIGNDTSQDDILQAIAADMTDGFMDGAGTANASPLIAATANIVSGQVLVEALSNNLKVNGAWATDLLDNAIFASVPDAVISTADLPATAEMLAQAEAAIAAAQAIAPSTALTNIATILSNLLPGTSPSEVETVLPPEMSDDLNDATTLVVMSTDSQLETVNSSVKQSRKNAPPKVSLTAYPATVDYNGTSTLSWSSTNAVSCSAVEGWTTTHAISGSVAVGPLTADTTFSINCINVFSKITTKSVNITVYQPNAIPVANDDSVNTDDITSINVNVLANDLNLEDGPVAVTLLDNPAHGIATVQTDNSITYTPNAGYAGGDSFSYKVMDINGDSATASVTLEISCTSCNITPTYLIMDNGDIGTSSTGTWTTSGGINPYGSDSVYSNTAGDTYTYSFDLPVSGTYEVYLWWTEYSNRSTTVPVEIVYENGTKNITLNQQLNGGQWNLLSTQNFADTARITIYSTGNGTTNADAVMLVPTNSSNPDNKITLNWNPNPDDITGYIVYFGLSADTATEMISDIPIDSTGFDKMVPSMDYQSWSDLGVLPGDTVCFTVRAYNSNGLSAWPTAQCITL